MLVTELGMVTEVEVFTIRSPGSGQPLTPYGGEAHAYARGLFGY